MDKFSSFRLFYDEFIYKKNILIHYDKIEGNINKIRELLFSLLSTNEKDKEMYKKTLNVIRTGIRKELEEILEKEPYLFELYYEMYKDNVDSKEKISDLPFVITCSFYEDYKLGGNKANRISRYTSKDKKKIRDEGKSLGVLLYFISLLNERDQEQYNRLIQLLTTYYNKNINMTLTYLENQEIFNKDKDNIIRTLKRDMEKAKIGLDYQYFTDKLDIAFRIKNKPIEELIEEELDNFFTNKYQDALKDDQVLLDSSLYHVIDVDTLNEFIEEENSKFIEYEKEYEANKRIYFKNSRFVKDLYQELVKYYFNSRLKIYEYEKYNMQQVVSSLIQLDRLSKELPDRLLKYKLFKASYSDLLNRDKNERYIIVNTIYELYSPYKILDRYEKDRKELNKVIDTLGTTFKNNLEYELLTNNIDIYPLITKNDILENLKSIEYNFIHTNYRDNLISKSELYDTREYDLLVIDEDLSIKDMITLYESIKKEIKELEIDNSELFQNLLINYVAHSIIKKKNIVYDKTDKELEESILKDISLEYLNTNYVDGVVIDKISKTRRKNEFLILFEEYKNNSAFNKLKGKYK